MIKALIFDLDGTLIDTIPVYTAAYIEVMRRELGLAPDKHQITEQFGKNAVDIMVALLQDLDIDPHKVDMAYIIGQIRNEFMDHIKKVMILPGTVELLEKTKGKYKLGVATSSGRYAADLALDRFGIRDYFSVIVTGDDVLHSKPNPEIFLIAAKRLGVAPKECVVFEDAVHGIAAAKAAGMRTVAVCTGACSKEEIQKANPNLILSSFKDFDEQVLSTW